MRYNTVYNLDLGDLSSTYYDLLIEEDFDFKTKDIKVDLKKNQNIITITISCNELIELKIGNSAVMKSLEIIDKTLNC